MGYYSTVVIAVSKGTYARDALIAQVFPPLLRNTEPSVITDSALFWYFEDQRWYPGYREVAEITDYLDSLEYDPVTKDPACGAMRLGEEFGDVETWGDPGHFDIYAYHGVNFPS